MSYELFLTAGLTTDLEIMNHDLAEAYAAMSAAPDEQRAGLRVRADALRVRRDAAREVLNQTLAAEVQRLDALLATNQQALAGATGANDQYAATR